MHNIKINPFLKWAGSKRLYLEYLSLHIPTNFNKYYEPFLGGGSMFFMIQPEHAILGDISSDLINTYLQVSKNVNPIIRYLNKYSGTKSEFYQVRNNRSKGNIKRAAEFIYIKPAGMVYIVLITKVNLMFHMACRQKK
ncbi:MAG: DNA adenine methylase [Saprospiraceae bacterium]|nr:DNA adenine methylase [Candidatus Opimibacter iunctus]